MSLTKEMDRSTYRPVQVDRCASCNDLIEMISASDAAELADVTVRAIYRWAEAVSPDAVGPISHQVIASGGGTVKIE